MRKVAFLIGVLAMCSLVGLAYAYKGASSNRAEPVQLQKLESPQPLGERADGVPAMVNFQGKLLNDVGNPVTDTLPMAFSIWDDPTAGTSLWNEVWIAVPVIDGIFNVLLGQSTPIPETVFEGSDRWLQTIVLLDTLLPRQSMVSVPYCYDADKVDNFHASATPGPNDLFPLSYGDGQWVNEGQADAITSGMILDGEIVRADCDPAFKAPYADTADYALASPAVDSARVAANSWRLENNTLTDLDSRWVNEGQADAITSGMILDGEIARADCDPAFKAPYADTADYALAFSGTVDSARVAGNSWRLENNTLTGLDGRWVNEGQANSVTSGMILDGEIVRADCDPAFKAPYADTADYALAFSGTVDSARVAGNSWRLENNTLTGLDGRWVNEGQANSVTSGMITDGAIVDGDVSATADIAPSKILGTAWTSLNDGAGSGLDADLLDGLDSGDFLSTASDYGRSGVAADLYEGAQPLTAKYVNEGQADAITTGMILDGTVATADLADGAVNSAKITDGAIVDGDVSGTADIDPTKILGTAWTSLNHGAGSGLDADFLDGLDSGDFLNTASDYGRSGVAADLYEGASTLTALYVNEGQVDAITTGMILDGEVATVDLADDAVTSVKITDGEVTTLDIADQAVTGAKIEVGANVSGGGGGGSVFEAHNTGIGHGLSGVADDASGYGVNASNPNSTTILGATGAAIYIDGRMRINDAGGDQPVGTATILNGTTNIMVLNNCASTASYIFVTQVYDFFAPHQAIPLQVEKGPGQFVIHTNNPVAANVQVMYLIIN